MTEDQRYEIAVLADDYSNKKMLFDCLAMANAYGKTAEESAKQSINYHIAEAEMLAAYIRLGRAKMAIAAVI